MKSRALRVTILTLFVGLLAGAAYVAWNEETARQAIAERARAFDEQVRAADRTLLDIRSAQPGYVAAGQGEDFWGSRVDALRAKTREALAALRARVEDAEARTELGAAATAFEDFEQMDRRAREYAESGQRLLASDLVFSDGIEQIEAASAALDRARRAELDGLERTARERQQTMFLAMAAAGGFGLFLMFALVPLPRPAAPAVPGKAAVETPFAAAEPAGSLRLSDGGAQPGEAKPIAAAPAPQVEAPAPAREQEVPQPVPAVDLPGVAAVCTELSRVVDSRTIPPALARAAELMNATGIVVWIADPDGRELAPIVAHGYPQNFLTRLGTIDRDAENVTAAAFRTGLLQTVIAEDGFPGAIAAPLQTPAGPVGVIAAEVQHDSERRDDIRAIATIVAAQLAMLMGPPSRSAGRTEVAGA